MKKYLAVILGMLFVFGLTATAFAIHAEIPSETQSVVAKGTTQVKLDGQFRSRGEYRQNVSDFDDDKGDHNAAYDSRIQIGVEAQVTPNTTGYVKIEVGGSSSSNNYNWGASSAGAKGIYTAGETKQGAFNIIEGWILHKGSGLIGIPAGIKVGHMPLSLGNQLFFKHTIFGDDAIVLFMDPTKELHIAALTAKLSEGTTTVNDDANAYVGLFVYKTKDFNVSGDVTYVNDQANGLSSATAIVTAAKGTTLWNYGLRGDVTVAGLGIKADIEMQGGESKWDSGVRNSTQTAAGDIKHKGYAYLVGLSYKLDPVKLSLDYAYGSGDDNSTDTSNKTFVTALSDTNNYTYVYDYRAKAATGSTQTGIANTQYIKLGASAGLTKDLTAALDLYVLNAAKKKAITLGTATTKGDSKKIGTEVDVNIKYNVDKNLVYYVEGGYLFAGAFYDTAAKGADNAYAIRNGLALSF